MTLYENNPKKYKDHILIFDGRLSGNMEESDLAKKAHSILDSKGLNPKQKLFRIFYFLR